MAAPACDREDRYVMCAWSPRYHRRVPLMTRMVMRELLLQNRFRPATPLGRLPKELCLAILRRVEVMVSL